MWIVAPIQKQAKIEGGREGGATSERPGTDHVISEPMRGLKKTASNGADKQTYKQTDRQTDIATP